MLRDYAVVETMELLDYDMLLHLLEWTDWECLDFVVLMAENKCSVALGALDTDAGEAWLAEDNFAEVSKVEDTLVIVVASEV